MIYKGLLLIRVYNKNYIYIKKKDASDDTDMRLYIVLDWSLYSTIGIQDSCTKVVSKNLGRLDMFPSVLLRCSFAV